MHRGFAAVLLSISLLATAAVRSACIPAEVRMDATHTAIDFYLHLPPGTTRIALEDLAPYSRRDLWQSPDESATVEETAIAARGAHRDLHLRMGVSRQPPHQDRAYAPFQRFADGTVAVYGPQFEAPAENPLQLCVRYVPVQGEQVIGFGHASSSPLSSAQPWPPGYVAFGKPYVQRHHGLLLVSDRGAPAWIRQRMAVSIPRLVDLYRQRLGPGTVPTVFLFA